MSDPSDRYSFDELSVSGGGLVGLGCCPGHRLTPWAVVPRIERLLDDLNDIAEWRPALVLSLMEKGELDFVGAPAGVIGGALSRSGRRWVHLPIRNLSRPDRRFESAWTDLYKDVDATLSSGGRLFIHCYAGLGRTGTVAARILMERQGLRAADAMALVRQTRPGSIETIDQERYLFELEGARRG